MTSPPLEGRYTPALVAALLALIPYILVTGGGSLYRDQLMHDINAETGALPIIFGISTAAYAFGALLGGDIVSRFPQRRLFLIWQALLAFGWLLTATASGTIAYGIGYVLAGFATCSSPRCPRRETISARETTCHRRLHQYRLFRAVAAGPLIGGIVTSAHAWRLLYSVLAVSGVLNFALAFVAPPTTQQPESAP